MFALKTIIISTKRIRDPQEEYDPAETCPTEQLFYIEIINEKSYLKGFIKIK